MSYIYAVYAGLFLMGALLPPMRAIDSQTAAIAHAWMGGCALTVSLLTLISAIKETK